MREVPPEVRRRELGGTDPIDRRLGTTAASPPWFLPQLRTRSALGLGPSLTPAIVFLPVGALLGPQVLGILSPRLLDRLGFVVTIALAVLGVIVGIALGREIRRAARLFVAACLQSFVTMAMVTAATAYFVTRTGVPLDASLAGFVLAIGLCAAASSATSADPDSEPAAAVAARVADLDDVLPIVLSVFVFALIGTTTRSDVSVMLLAPPLIGLAVGTIGWLLFERAESGPERMLFVLGTLALAGGGAAYLHLSPLAVGVVAGVMWTLVSGRVDRVVEKDLRRVQHPLVVLLLVIAGASAVFSTAAVWLLPPYLLFRIAGKVTGSWLAAPMVDVRSSDLASFLLPSGVLAIAFALNFSQVLPGGSGQMLLSTVAVGTAAFELFALVVVPRWGPRGRG